MRNRKEKESFKEKEGRIKRGEKFVLKGRGPSRQQRAGWGGPGVVSKGTGGWRLSGKIERTLRYSHPVKKGPRVLSLLRKDPGKGTYVCRHIFGSIHRSKK